MSAKFKKEIREILRLHAWEVNRPKLRELCVKYNDGLAWEQVLALARYYRSVAPSSEVVLKHKPQPELRETLSEITQSNHWKMPNRDVLEALYHDFDDDTIIEKVHFMPVYLREHAPTKEKADRYPVKLREKIQATMGLEVKKVSKADLRKFCNGLGTCMTFAELEAWAFGMRKTATKKHREQMKVGLSKGAGLWKAIAYSKLTVLMEHDD